jgi:hypothetical protein
MFKVHMVEAIRQNLNDLGITYFDISDLDDSVQDAYDEVVVYCQCIEKFVDLDQLAIASAPEGASPWLNMTKLVPDYYRTIAILNRSTKQFLTPIIDRESDMYQYDWQKTRYNPCDFIINAPDWIAFPGWYTDAQPLRLFYKAQAPILLYDTDEFKINHNYAKLIEFYSTADLLEQNQEFTKATKWWLDYETLLEEYHNKIQLLSKSDRIFYRGENRAFPSMGK